jgi:hypothetical protein
MNKSVRRNEKITGAFFISATTTAIIGVLCYGPVLSSTEILESANAASTQIAWGVFFELILAVSNIGTGIMLYPRLKRYSASWGLGYSLFRLLEVVFILIGLLSMLSIVSLSKEALTMGTEAKLSFQGIAEFLKKVYGWAFILGPHFMLGINTLIYSSIFYLSKILPPKLAILGISGAVLILVAAILEIFGYIPHFSSTIILLALPIAVYEMVLAGWLILKGFNKEAYSPLQPRF